MPSWLLGILAALAVYRLSQLIACDAIFTLFRIALGRKAAKGKWYWKSLADLVHCPYCLGFWLALIATLFIPYSNLITFLLWWFGIAGAQTFLESLSPCGADRE